MLRKPVSVRNTNIVIDTTFRTDLSLAYESFGYHASLINKPCNFYKSASYISDEIQCHLNIDDVVTIQVADYGESYAVIPLTVVDKVRKVHFVHDCNARCKDNHNLENKRYFKNDFFFKAI